MFYPTNWGSNCSSAHQRGCQGVWTYFHKPTSLTKFTVEQRTEIKPSIQHLSSQEYFNLYYLSIPMSPKYLRVFKTCFGETTVCADCYRHWEFGQFFYAHMYKCFSRVLTQWMMQLFLLPSRFVLCRWWYVVS